jgi:hypothetical protein
VRPVPEPYIDPLIRFNTLALDSFVPFAARSFRIGCSSVRPASFPRAGRNFKEIIHIVPAEEILTTVIMREEEVLVFSYCNIVTKALWSS